MEENTIIEGERYLGIFAAELRAGKLWKGSEYAECEYDGYWYVGTGVVKDKQTGKRHIFAFETKTLGEYWSSGKFAENNYSAEEAIVHFNQKGPFYPGNRDFKPKVLPGKYQKIIDLSLADLVYQVKQSGKQLPTITPQRLKLEELVGLGLIASEEGQVHLAMSFKK